MVNKFLNKRYTIETELGHGSMGVVYHAYDTLLDREVAVKILNDSNLSSGNRVRLLTEARAVARLNHPNIVTIYDVGEENE